MIFEDLAFGKWLAPEPNVAFGIRTILDRGRVPLIAQHGVTQRTQISFSLSFFGGKDDLLKMLLSPAFIHHS